MGTVDVGDKASNSEVSLGQHIVGIIIWYRCSKYICEILVCNIVVFVGDISNELARVGCPVEVQVQLEFNCVLGAVLGQYIVSTSRCSIVRFHSAPSSQDSSRGL